MRTAIFLYCTFLFAGLASAQCSDATTLAYRAYLENSPEQYAAAVAAAQRLPKTVDNLYALAAIAHQAATMTMVGDDKVAFDRYLGITEMAIDDLWELDDQHPAAHGLYSGYLGLRIAQSPAKGMFFGPKAAKYARKGVSLSASDAAANYFLGSNFYYTPENWGGDAKEAALHLKVAVDNLPDAEPGCDWVALQILALYGQAQAKMGDKEGARLTYLRALKREPAFNYVTYELLPALDRTGK